MAFGSKFNIQDSLLTNLVSGIIHWSYSNSTKSNYLSIFTPTVKEGFKGKRKACLHEPRTGWRGAAKRKRIIQKR